MYERERNTKVSTYFSVFCGSKPTVKLTFKITYFIAKMYYEKTNLAFFTIHYIVIDKYLISYLLSYFEHCDHDTENCRFLRSLHLSSNRAVTFAAVIKGQFQMYLSFMFVICNSTVCRALYKLYSTILYVYESIQISPGLSGMDWLSFRLPVEVHS